MYCKYPATNFNLSFSEALLGKEHKDQQVNYDVKIGDGMDIAIHGENGNCINSIN